jgi:exosortase
VSDVVAFDTAAGESYTGLMTPGFRKVASAGLIGILLLALFYPALRWLAGEWLGNDYYSHGPLVPLISAFIAWRLWAKRPAEQPRAASANIGFVVLAAALAAYLGALGQRAYFAAALSLIAILAGLVWYLLGAATLKRMAFPLLFLLFMVPLPFVEPLSVPLAQVTGAISAACVAAFGVPIVVNGAQVSLPNAQLVVGAQCSGLRSIVTLLTLVGLGVFVLQGPRWGKGLLMLSAIPIAALGNVLRVSSLLGVANAWGANAGFKYYHDYSGIVFFFSALALLLGLSRWVGCREIRPDIL